MSETLPHAAALDDSVVDLWRIRLIQSPPPDAATTSDPMQRDQIRDDWPPDRGAPDLAFPSNHDDLAGALSPDEAATAGRRKHTRDRQRYVRSHVALRTILAAYVGTERASEPFRVGVRGKPHLGGDGPIEILEFNMAHSGDWGVVAVGRSPLGVDVEQLRDIAHLDRMIARCCGAAEQRRLAALVESERHAGFLRCWTGKEALLKAIGCGLRADASAIATPPHPGDVLQAGRAPGALGGGGWQWSWFEVDANHVGAIVAGPSVRRIVRREFAARGW